jgi:hypothetical protein
MSIQKEAGAYKRRRLFYFPELGQTCWLTILGSNNSYLHLGTLCCRHGIVSDSICQHRGDIKTS